MTMPLRAPSLSRPVVPGLMLCLLAALSPGRAETPATPLPARIETLWSTPITAGTTSADAFRGEGLVLRAGAAAPGGAVVALGSRLGAQGSARVLLPDAAGTGPDGAVPLELAAPRAWLGIRYRPVRAPAALSLAVGGRGEVWLGGSSNSSTGIASTDHCDAYLAVLDRDAKPVWERAYSAGSCSHIEGIAPAAEGGVAVVGRQDRRSSWLARIAPDGRLIAERRFGNGKGAAIAPLPDGRFVVAGFTSRGEAATYQDDVAAWLSSGTGELHGPVLIREAVNRSGISHFGRVAASAAADGAYVASSWGDPSGPRPVEVARIGPDGGALWRRGLPDTVGARPGRRGVDGCAPSLATLADGDALVACALNGEIHLYRLGRETGTLAAARLPLPACQRAHPAALFLVAHRDGTVFLGGSRPGNNVAANCSWLGRLSTRDD